MSKFEKCIYLAAVHEIYQILNCWTCKIGKIEVDLMKIAWKDKFHSKRIPNSAYKDFVME